MKNRTGGKTLLLLLLVLTMVCSVTLTVFAQEPDGDATPQGSSWASETPSSTNSVTSEGSSTGSVENSESTPESSGSGSTSGGSVPVPDSSSLDTDPSGSDVDSESDESDLQPDALGDGLFAPFAGEIGPDNVFQNVDITFLDENGQPLPAGERPNGSSSIQIDFNVAFPNPPTVGDQYEYELPDEIVIKTADTFTIVDPATGVEFTVELVPGSPSKVIVTLTDNPNNLTDITGDFHFEGHFKDDLEVGPGDTTITFPLPDGDKTINVDIRPDVESSVDKQGSADNVYNPSEITWTVDVNKTQDQMNYGTVTEHFPPELTYESAEVYELIVLADGTTQRGAGPLSTPHDYGIDNITGNIVFTGNNAHTQKAFEIVYKTKVDPIPEYGGDFTYKNTVTFDPDSQDASRPTIDAAATLDVTFGKKIEKDVTYNPSTQEFTWTIHYNHNGNDIKAGDTLTDTITGPGGVPYDFTGTTFTINQMTIDPTTGAETPIIPALLYGTDYEVAINPVTGEFLITFKKAITGPIDITYTTKANGIITDPETYANQVVDNEGHGDNQDGKTDQPVLKKNLVLHDDVNHVLYWEIEINTNNYPLEDWSITDSISQGLTFVNGIGAVIIYDGGAPYDDTTTNDVGSAFDVSINGTGDIVIKPIPGATPTDYSTTNNGFKINVATKYTFESGIDNYINNAAMDWTTGGKTHHVEDGDNYKPPIDQVNNGLKEGTYNAKTKEITWRVWVNARGIETIPFPTLVDPIGPGQTYVACSAKVYSYSLNTSGGIDKSSIRPSTHYQDIDEPSAGNGEILTVTFFGNVAGTGRNMVEFRTKIDDHDVQTDYTNTANYNYEDSTGPHSNTLDAEVGLNGIDNYVDKSGKQLSDGFVQWSVTINPQQTYMTNIVITDTPSDNQIVDTSSLAVYGAIVSGNLNIQKNPAVKLVLGTDYTVEYVADSTGKFVLTVKFLHEINETYILEYKCTVLFDASSPIAGTASNHLTIHADGVKEIDDNTGGSTSVRPDLGGGSVTGVQSFFTIHKTDDKTGAALAGAVFQLYTRSPNVAGGAWVSYGGEMTTDATGTLAYPIFYNSTMEFMVKEVKAPDGYTIPSNLANGVVFTMPRPAGQAGVLEFANPKITSSSSSSTSSSSASNSSATTPPTTPGAPQTGDTNNMGLWIILGISSITILAAGMVLVLHKQSKNAKGQNTVYKSKKGK